MTPEREEADLREEFQRLRREEERCAPAFSSLWAAATVRAQSPAPSGAGQPRPVSRAAALVWLVVLLVAAFYAALGPPAEPPPAGRGEVVALSQWRAPSDVLLETPGRQLLRTVPKLSESSVRVKIQLPKED